jgi:hypothetical protein
VRPYLAVVYEPKILIFVNFEEVDNNVNEEESVQDYVEIEHII